MTSTRKQVLLRLHRLLQVRFHSAIAAGKSFSEVKLIYLKMKSIYAEIEMTAAASEKFSSRLLRDLTSLLIKTGFPKKDLLSFR